MMRLMVKVPEVKKELEAGKISLTTTAKLAAHIRREKIEPSETSTLLKSIIGKTSRDVDKIFTSESTEAPRMDRLKVITPETTRITIDVDLEFLDLMNRVRELKGHTGSSAQELFKVAMLDLVKRREIKKEVKPTKAQPTLPAKKVVSAPAA